MKIEEVLFDVVASLAETYDEVEVCAKRGRSRTLHWTAAGPTTALRREEGWAVRAGDSRRSFYFASTGSPRADAPWPEADGQGLRLPSPRPVPRWSAPSSLDAPLIGETEALHLFEGLARELDTELPGARLVAGHLDDGSSETQLASSRELASLVRHRVAVLYLEAIAGGGRSSVSLAVAERDARRLNPKVLARRLADRLAVHLESQGPLRDRGDFLLAPEVMVALLGALTSLWCGPQAEQKARPLVDRRGRLGSRSLTLIDDGRLADGVLAAPVDGEGQPTREVVLVDEGFYRQPLLAWWQTQSSPAKGSGCCLRPGWRDLPKPGPSHLYLKPDPDRRVAELLADVGRGYYLLTVDGAPRIDFEGQRFAVPVSGFVIDSGRATGSMSGSWLVGTLPSLLGGLRAKARDLTFSMHGGGMIGAPTVLVRGLELRQRP